MWKSITSRPKDVVRYTALLTLAGIFHITFQSSAQAGGPTRYVETVIDGDTIILEGSETVRLIGIDAPETHHPNKAPECFGQEATHYLRERIEHQRVRLKYGEERTDVYGRTLAYVMHKGKHINRELVANGFALAYRQFPHRHLKKFIHTERMAQRRRVGLWSSCQLDCDSTPCTIAPVQKGATK
jgi:micrococcal nuclease